MRKRYLLIPVLAAVIAAGCGGLEKTRDVTPPAIPANFRLVGAGDGQAFFRWDPSEEPDFREYVVERADSAGAPFAVIIRLADSEYTDRYLEYERTYYYRIQAGDQAGNYSGFTDPIDVTPLNLSSPLRPRGVIARGRNLSAVPIVGISLQWEPNTESDLLGYLVYRGTTPDFAVADSALVDSTDTVGFLDTAVEPERRYWYSVVAVDLGQKHSLPSSPADDILLASPRLLSPVGDVQVSPPVDFQWERVDQADGYRVYVGRAAFGPAIWSSALLEGDVSRFRYDGPALAPNVAYYWWVAAHSRRTDVLADGTEVESDLNSLSDYGRFIVKVVDRNLVIGSAR